MNERDFENEAQEGDEVVAIKRSLLRVYAAAMARGRVDEARKTLSLLVHFLPQKNASPNEPSPEAIELEMVRGHLTPLNLAPEGTAAAELARLAADRIIGGIVAPDSPT